MGISYTVDDERLAGGLGRVTELTASFDTSYTSGGEPITAADARLNTIDTVTVQETVTEGGYVVGYDASAGTLKAYTGNGAGSPLSEVAGATDLSTETVRLSVRGNSEP